MPGGKQGSRFEMLINVALGGMDKFDKLGSSAKKSALGMKTLTQAVDKLNVSHDTAKLNLKDTRAALSKYIKVFDKYAIVGKRIESLENRKRALNKAEISELKRKKTAQAKHNSELVRLKNELNKTMPGLIKFDGTLKKNRSQTDKLKKRMAILNGEYRKLGKANQKAAKENTKFTRSQKKVERQSVDTTKALKKNEFAVDKLRQRLKRSDIPVFRKRLGALRNQILVLTFAFGGLVAAFRRAFDESNMLEASLKGLGAVATNTGNGLLESKAAALELAESGLLTVQDSAAGLKNLLSAGFGLPEAIKMMNSLTDAASFNRQGTLALGQAVVGATQGIKNQNSIMVDNAGITKNLSIMYEEYAESIGTTGGKLDEAGKRQAIMTGIMKEGALFAGDASRVLGTMSGQLTLLGNSSRLAAAEVGKLLQPLAKGFIAAFGGATVALAATVKGFTDSEKTMGQFIATGDKIEELFTALGNGFSAIKSGIDSTFGSFINMALLIAKLVVGMRLLRTTTSFFAKSQLALREQVQNTTAVLGPSQYGGSLGYINTETGKATTRFQTFRIEQMKGKIALEDTKRTLMATSGNMGLFGKTVNAAKVQVTMLGLSLRNTQAAIAAAGGAMRIFGQAALTLGKAIGKLGIQMLVIQGIFSFIQMAIKFFKGMSTSQTALDKNTTRATKSLTAQRDALKAVTTSMDGTIKASLKYAGLSDEVKKVTDARLESLEQLKLIQEETEKLAKAQTLDEQGEIKARIQNLEGEYDGKVAAIKAGQREIERAIADHNARLATINTSYQAMVEQSAKANGLDDLNKLKVQYADHLKSVEEFEKTKAVMAAGSQVEIQRAERQQQEMGLMLTEMINDEKEKIMRTHYNKLSDLNDSYISKLQKADQTDFQRTKEEYKDKMDFEKKKIDEIRAAGIRQIDALSNKSRSAFLDVATGVTGGISAPQADGMSLSRPKGVEAAGGGGAGRFGEVEAVTGAYANLASVQKTYRDALNLAGDDTKKVGALQKDYRAALGVVEEQLAGLANGELLAGDGKQRLRNLIKGTISEIDTEQDAIGKSAIAYNKLGKELTDHNKQRKDTEAIHSQSMINMISQLSQEERLKLSAILYRDELKNLAIELDKIAAAEAYGMEQREGFIGTNQIQINNLQKQIDLQRANNNQSNFFNQTLKEMNPTLLATAYGIRDVVKGTMSMDGVMNILNQTMGLSADFMLKQFNAQEQFRFGQEKTMETLENRKAMLTTMQDSEQGLLDKMKASTGESGIYTQADIDRQALRVQASAAKVDAINQEITATKELQTVEAELFDENQAAEAMAERITAFQTMATKFSGFVTKMQNLQHKNQMQQRKYEHGLTKEVKAGKIERETMDKLAAEHQVLMNAKNKLDQAKFTADLVREIGKQIMLFAAKKAAQSGNIVAAAGMLAAGIAGMAIANNAANKMEQAAQGKYDTAEQKFTEAEAAIRGADPLAEEQDGSSATGSQKFGGSIKAENLAVTISPTVVISGEQVFIGQGSVTEFGAEMQALLLDSMNDAIENREIDLSNAANQGG